eukprot:CAMPEP_0115120418 /NCGR_PEP_ID=MMETSP0227-20121206/45674_1 /TAXON_ID=89957 /ORGANISM="Polarella glacialis, Strain CCMP 1383" /LENGTH=96 /DNA_ID=CAMNT_0002522073 /DNA_START=123 /DNA_END=413 /DNA_ORIENTATION=+
MASFVELAARTQDREKFASKSPRIHLPLVADAISKCDAKEEDQDDESQQGGEVEQRVGRLKRRFRWGRLAELLVPRRWFALASLGLGRDVSPQCCC